MNDSIFVHPKIDTHVHVTDPDRFPFGADNPYHPSGQEIGTAGQLARMMQTYGIRHALVVQPNSGYGPDNSCLLDAVGRSQGALKGIAIVDPEADLETLRALKAQGIVGVAFNPTIYGADHYRHAEPLFERLAALDMLVNLQVEHALLGHFAPWIERVPVTVLIDHCGRPTPSGGLDQPGFRALLDLADTGRVYVKLSGYAKFAETPYPFEDCWPFVRAIVRAFTLKRCLWASDWPYLRAQERQDVGPLVQLVEQLFPDPRDRAQLLWHTPNELFGFGTTAETAPAAEGR